MKYKELNKKQKKEFRVKVCKYCFSAGCYLGETPCDKRVDGHHNDMSIEYLERLNIENHKYWEKGIKDYCDYLKQMHESRRKDGSDIEVTFKDFEDARSTMREYLRQNDSFYYSLNIAINEIIDAVREKDTWGSTGDHLLDVILGKKGTLNNVRFSFTTERDMYIYGENKSEIKKNILMQLNYDDLEILEVNKITSNKDIF